jgi:hypothetical protein
MIVLKWIIDIKVIQFEAKTKFQSKTYIRTFVRKWIALSIMSPKITYVIIILWLQWNYFAKSSICDMNFKMHFLHQLTLMTCLNRSQFCNVPSQYWKKKYYGNNRTTISIFTYPQYWKKPYYDIHIYE